MFSQVLVTKLFIPLTRPEFVSRPRLIDQLDKGLNRKLTLISAPAGFGKTTLVTGWLHKLLENAPEEATFKNKIAWLSLDEGDRDPTRFLTYFIMALNQALGNGASLGKGVLNILQSSQIPAMETILITLINELVTIQERIILILDDYHLVDSQSIHNALDFLLENLPPQMHLVIVTREDPILSLSRLRARGQLNEIRAIDLRFTLSEASEFLNQTMRLNLSKEDIAVLESRTEGWITGLQLAALSMQGHVDRSAFIKSFSGSYRLVLDYLIEEVVNQQSEDIQIFLLQTSILDRLTGSLCDAILGKDNSQQLLETLERVNLFIISLDEKRCWYRYHHLFADLLQQRLQRTNPEAIPDLHKRASIWFEQNNHINMAIHHAFSAKEYDRCAALLSSIADPLWEQGGHVKLRNWLEKLPEQSICKHPHLCIYRFWFSFSTGQQEAAQRYLKIVEDSLKRESDLHVVKTSLSDSERVKLQGRLGAIQALICTWNEDLPGIIRHAGLAMTDLPQKDPWRRMAAMALGDAQYYQGDVEAAYQTRVETLAACHPEDDLFFYMIANLKVATSLREMGRLKETIEICQQQLDFAKEHGLQQTIFVGWAYTIMALSMAEQNNLDEALVYANRSIELNLGGDFAFLCFSYIVLAKVHFYRGDYAKAEESLRAVVKIEQNNAIPFYTTGSVVGWQARLFIAQNQLEKAEQRIANQDYDHDLKKMIMYDHVIVVKARLLLNLGKIDEAANLLIQLRAACEEAGHKSRLIEVLVLQTLTQQAAGETSLAIQTLVYALKLAKPGDFVRVFIDEGPPMAQLLYKALSFEIFPDYIRNLLRAFPMSVPEKNIQSGPDSSLIEPLSEREIEVLQLIADGLSNQEISSHLYLSLNTIKAHTRNIYGKLGVNNRTQASARGRALGWISD